MNEIKLIKMSLYYSEARVLPLLLIIIYLNLSVFPIHMLPNLSNHKATKIRFRQIPPSLLDTFSQQMNATHNDGDNTRQSLILVMVSEQYLYLLLSQNVFRHERN